MFRENEPIWAPNPTGEGRLPAVYLEAGSPGEGIEVEGRRADGAWVRFVAGERDGETTMVVHAEVEPRVALSEGGLMGQPVLGGPDRFEMPDALDLAGYGDLAKLLEEALRTEDPVTKLSDDLEAVAEALEDLAVRSDPGNVKPVYAMNLATELRLESRGTARRGQPLDWQESTEGSWSATDEGGTYWRIDPPRSGSRWGVAIDLFEPDFWVGSKESAMALAEEVAVRPKFS